MWARTAFTAVCGGLAALVLATSGVLWATVREASDGVERVPAFAGTGERPQLTANGSVDVLLVATDGARRLSYGVLAHVSRRHDTTVLVDLPAGSVVTVAGKRRTLWHAYADGGPRLLVRAVEAATEVRLDGYAEVSTPDVARLVGHLGGLDVCVPVAVRDAGAKLRLAAGERHLTAAQAVAYLRTKVGGPLSRVRHAQVLFGAVTERLFGTAAVLRQQANRAAVTAGAGAVRVDEGFDTTLARRLTLALRDPYGDRVAIVAVPAAKTTRTTVTWQRRSADHLFEQLRTDAEFDATLVTPVAVGVAPQSVRVLVRNGTSVEGLAGDAADELAGYGFAIREPENASRRVSTTTVYYNRAYEKQARAVQAALPGSRLATMRTKTSTVLVVLGADYTGVRQVTYVENGARGDAESGDPVTGNGPCG